jgi:DNA-binding SARP family transcriptional activator
LALNPARTVSRARLSELFWPDLCADAVKHRLHIAASGARTFLREILNGVDAIRCTPEGYAWTPGLQVTSDISRFTDLYRNGSTEAMSEAVALYGGELFAGDQSDWLQPARVKYATMYATMLERLASEAFSSGSFETALHFGLDLLAADRAHEGASRLVMRSFSAVGRRGQAAAEYETLRAYLRKHLGIEPMPETTALIRTIMGHDGAVHRTGALGHVQQRS